MIRTGDEFPPSFFPFRVIYDLELDLAVNWLHCVFLFSEKNCLLSVPIDGARGLNEGSAISDDLEAFPDL
jgi:hypothetical protein